jgi:hypothetical protein
LVGYARTSTIEQQAGLEAQQRDLRTAGCRKIFSEQTSSVGPRPQLEAALDYCREGDTLAVTKLDRLARSARHLPELVDKLEAKSVALTTKRTPKLKPRSIQSVPTDSQIPFYSRQSALAVWLFRKYRSTKGNL